MNRIDICLGKGANSAPANPAHGQLFEAKHSDSLPRLGTKFATFSPLHYEPKYAYPLIVWLHGSGESEVQLRRVMPAISLRNYASIAPRGDACADNGLQRAFSWEQTPSQIEQAQQSVLDCIAAAQLRFNIAAQRIFLAGFDAGGTMALRVAMSNPEKFAGVASLAGGFRTATRLFSVLMQRANYPFSWPTVARASRMMRSKSARTCAYCTRLGFP